MRGRRKKYRRWVILLLFVTMVGLLASCSARSLWSAWGNKSLAAPADVEAVDGLAAGTGQIESDTVQQKNAKGKGDSGASGGSKTAEIASAASSAPADAVTAPWTWELGKPDGQQLAASGAKRGTKLVALTFDDGPDDRYTPAILSILHKYQVKATFFVVGEQTKRFGSVLKRIVQEGHAVGNHSFSHADLTKITEAEIQNQVNETDKLIREAVGFTPKLFRAPYGAVDDRMRPALQDSGRSIVGWTVDTRDWAGTPVKTMRELVNEHTKPGGIILMHSFGGKSISHTVELLPLIIEDLRKKGYSFVTIPELEAAKGNKL
ncbi:polysaccharide deacetylase family protein [Paenibacillus sp. y28]|uniref:polysaccharide deacetylase family protein n=1 Tax=Paenibacillus sp. y28 TaxID=3129110 RepID=UPI0030198731